MGSASSAPIPIAVEGGSVPAWVRGHGSTTILFLHGWSLDHRIWLPQLDDAELADRYRLIAIDRRGFGMASAAPDLAREIADVAALLDQLEIDRAIIVGQSQAGRVTLQCGFDLADRAAGLVLVGAPVAGFHPLPRPEEDVPVSRYRALVLEGRVEEMKRDWARHPLIAGGGTSAAPIAAMLADYDGRDLRADAPPPGPDMSVLGAIAAPMLVVVGEQDVAWRRLVGDAIAYAVPNARRAGIPGAGHLCNADAPAAFNRLLDDFAVSLNA